MPRSFWIDGSATFTTVLSSMIMKRPTATATSVHHLRFSGAKSRVFMPRIHGADPAEGCARDSSTAERRSSEQVSRSGSLFCSDLERFELVSGLRHPGAQQQAAEAGRGRREDRTREERDVVAAGERGRR